MTGGYAAKGDRNGLYFFNWFSKCTITKTLVLGHAVNSGSAGGSKDVKTCRTNIFDGL